MKKTRSVILGISILTLILVLSTLVVLAGNDGAATVSEPKFENTSKTLTSHAPIYIEGNADFSDADDDGVSNPNAAGTEIDPYIIENWDIDANTANGIYIGNTNVYFIIRNCVIHDGKSNYNYGVYFCNAQNGKMDDVTSYNNWYGIYLWVSSNYNITNCNVYNNNWDGIFLVYYSNNNIIGNTFINNGISIWGYSLADYIQNISTTNLVNGKPLYYFLNQNNLNIDNWDIGQLILVNCTNSTIKNVNISYTEVGIEMAFSTNILITNCDVYNNSNFGIWLLYSSNNTITDCAIYNNHDGILQGDFYGGYNYNQITNCNVYNNTVGIRLGSSSNNKVHYCNIYNNTNYGVYNWDSEVEYQVNATYNWWGSVSGPYHPSTNPSGTGDNVTDNVVYNPWLTEPWTGEIPNQPPTAFMDPILPNPATQGQTVTFTGRGYDSDGTIVAYNWRSSIDGQLNTSASFSLSTLSVGTHTIYFKAQDNNGTWSAEVYQTLVINPSAQPTLTVTVNANPITINSSGASTITITVTNSTTPVSGATINLISNNGGGFSSVTDNGDGTYTATFTAPSVATQTVCRITANVTKTGYTNNSNYIDVTVNPVVGNHAPIVNSITANPTTVNTGGTATIIVDASDEDTGDILTYHYTCTGGTISGSGSTVTWTAPSTAGNVTWTAPNTAGNYTITVYVNDSIVDSNSKSVSVTVTSPEKKEEPKGFIPAFETTTLLIAIIGVYAILLRRRQKSRNTS